MSYVVDSRNESAKRMFIDRITLNSHPFSNHKKKNTQDLFASYVFFSKIFFVIPALFVGCGISISALIFIISNRLVFDAVNRQFMLVVTVRSLLYRIKFHYIIMFFGIQ